jgi:ABC-type branched-subunit amino acid transport system ATPase component
MSHHVSEKFKKTVKHNVTENFNRSYLKYQAFEEKHRFFYTLALKLADSAIILDTGEVVFRGTAQEVLDNKELREEYLAI